ncbi:LYR motif-containing protein 2-like [Saccostrea echinata]|uniref:LYR motif-containing protein 2-like n=1 Tax=Saccostrea echinata TaxID=191078 RepID=UPI002A82BDF9|nr:LYR motif-containing protein 2-like [Saccostrea echinata]
MSRRLPRNVMSLERFILRSEVLKMYKQMLRLVRKIPDQNQRQQLQKFIRQDFELNKNIQDEEAIKMNITRGKNSMKELERTVHLVQ